MQGLFESIEDEALMGGPTHPPADDAAGTGIDDESYVDIDLRIPPSELPLGTRYNSAQSFFDTVSTVTSSVDDPDFCLVYLWRSPRRRIVSPLTSPP